MALIDKKSLYDLVPGEGPTGQMNGLQGPQFANPEQSSPSLHEEGLAGLYNSSVHGINYGPMEKDLDGLAGPTFANGESSAGIHVGGIRFPYWGCFITLNGIKRFINRCPRW